MQHQISHSLTVKVGTKPTKITLTEVCKAVEDLAEHAPGRADVTYDVTTAELTARWTTDETPPDRSARK